VSDTFPEVSGDPSRIITKEHLAVDKLVTLLEHLEYEQARNLAKEGNYAEAQTILVNLLRTSSNPLVMDLLARVYAQQGLITEARKMWEKALAIDPKNPDFSKGLAFVTSKQEKISETRFTTKRLLVLFGVIALFSLILVSIFQTIAVRRSINQIAAQSTPNVIPAEQIIENTSIPDAAQKDTLEKLTAISENNQSILTKVDNNQQTLEKLSLTLDTIQPTIEPTKIPMNLDIDVIGTTVTTTESGVQIRIEERLFLYNDTFTDHGQEILKQLGMQLEPYMGKIQIKVTGYTDSLERDKTNIPFDRGIAVVKYLIDQTRLPTTIFTIASGEGLPPPYPTGSTGDPYRERTVILEVIYLE